MTRIDAMETAGVILMVTGGFLLTGGIIGVIEGWLR